MTPPEETFISSFSCECFELQMVFMYTDNSTVVLAITVEVRIEIAQMGKDNLS